LINHARSTSWNDLTNNAPKEFALAASLALVRQTLPRKNTSQDRDAYQRRAGVLGRAPVARKKQLQKERERS